MIETTMAEQDVKLPPIAESVTEGTLLNWHKNAGDYVEKDEPLAEFETDKANVDLPSPFAGVMTKTVVEVGATVRVGEVVAKIDPEARAGAGASSGKATAPAVAPAPTTTAAPPD